MSEQTRDRLEQGDLAALRALQARYQEAGTQAQQAVSAYDQAEANLKAFLVLLDVRYGLTPGDELASTDGAIRRGLRPVAAPEEAPA